MAVRLPNIKLFGRDKAPVEIKFGSDTLCQLKPSPLGVLGQNTKEAKVLNSDRLPGQVWVQPVEGAHLQCLGAVDAIKHIGRHNNTSDFLQHVWGHELSSCVCYDMAVNGGSRSMIRD